MTLHIFTLHLDLYLVSFFLWLMVAELQLLEMGANTNDTHRDKGLGTEFLCDKKLLMNGGEGCWYAAFQVNL